VAEYLSRRVQNRLLWTGEKEGLDLTVPENVVKFGYAKLLHKPGFGIRTMIEVQEWLHSHGLSFDNCSKRRMNPDWARFGEKGTNV